MPQSITGESLYAEGTSGIDVRAVRFRTRAVGEEPREEVRELDSRIAAAQTRLASNVSDVRLVTRQLTYVDQLETFVVPTGHADLNRGVLNAEALKAIVLFGFEQGKAAHAELLRLENEAKGIQKEIALLERKRAELLASSSKILREAVIFLEKRSSEAASINLSYTVSNCGWLPTYNIRAKQQGSGVQVEYNAIIQQTTGEDWSNVALTLSTATPALSAAGPGLAPFAVSLHARGPAQEAMPEMAKRAAAAETYQNLAKQQQQAQARQREAVQTEESVSSAWAINSAANSIQTFELNTGKDVLASVRSGSGVVDGPSISYELAGTVSLASRSDQQMVRIVLANLEGVMSHVATPVLTPNVYREASVTNNSGYAFLSGPVNVYLDNRFVGRAELETVAEGETFVVGLGADPRLRARRELVDKSEKTQGGNRILNLAVRIEIENFHDRAVSVRVLDRLPHSDRPESLRVTMGKLSDPLSTDPVYLATDRPTGILRFDIEAKASSAGSNSRSITYDYTLEFDRNLSLEAPAAQQQERFREEFERIMRTRSNR
jgi:hypothetical protein